jgi:hypothetical protein
MPPPRWSRTRLAVICTLLAPLISRMPSNVLVCPNVGRATSLSVMSAPEPPPSLRIAELFTVTKLLRMTAPEPENAMP